MNKQTATFLGGNLNLTYAGKHAYAYSAAMPASTSVATALDFTTGAHYIEGTFHLSVALEEAGIQNAAVFSNINFNGNSIANLWAGFGAADAIAFSEIKCILPPFTEVSGTIISDENAASKLAFLSFAGRVYDLDE